MCCGLGALTGEVCEDGERRKIRKPVASRAARMMVSGFVRRRERESAIDGILPLCQKHLAQPCTYTPADERVSLFQKARDVAGT